MSASVEHLRPVRRARSGHEPIRSVPTIIRDPAASTDPAVLEGYAKLLEESGTYRVLRALPARRATPLFRAPGARLALVVDVETTGPDPRVDEVIELAVVPFTYAPSGRVIAVHEPVSQLRQPSRAIPARVTRATGLDAAAVEGRTVDQAALAPLLAEATLVVAHNAAWDRPFLERLVPGFADLPWACSMSQVAWTSATNHGLAAIAASQGFFYVEHRAVDDCLATIEVLGNPMPRSGAPAMAELLATAFRETCRVWALNSPFQARDVLRKRGYRWSNGDDGRLRAWVTDVDETALDDELSFLASQVFGSDADVPVTRVTAYERFSTRG